MYQSTPLYYSKYMSKSEIKCNVISLTAKKRKIIPYQNLNLIKLVDFLENLT